jgi:hypothetical protein
MDNEGNHLTKSLKLSDSEIENININMDWLASN